MSKGHNFAASTRLTLSKPGPWVILGPAVIGSLLGFLLSFGFPPKYTSQSLILVEPPDPQSLELSPASADLVQPIAKLQDVLSEEELKPRIDRLALGQNMEQEMAEIRRHTRLTPVTLKQSDSGTDGADSGRPQSATAFHVEYTAPTPAEAQLICNAVTSIFLQDNLDAPSQQSLASTEHLKAIDAAKQDLDQQNAKLVRFKKAHTGQLAADVEKNMTVSADLHAQSNMLSEKLQMAQQNKAQDESLLQRQSSSVHEKAVKHDASQKIATTAVLEKRLSDLQSQLLQLQAQYADDHPDVIRTKTEVASIEKQLAQVKSANESQSDAMADEQETSETRQLRSRIQQDEQTIDQITLEQKRIQNQINILQARLNEDPDVESEYQQLLRDRDAAQKKYAMVTRNPGTEQNGTVKSLQPAGRIRMLSPASIPHTPSFPNRLFFAISGWLGLAVVMRVVLWITRPGSLGSAIPISKG